MTNVNEAHERRARGTRALSMLTVGVAAGSVVAVGTVVAYDAHLSAATTSRSTSSPSSSTTDDSSSGQLQGSSNAPAVTQQPAQATSGGS